MKNNEISYRSTRLTEDNAVLTRGEHRQRFDDLCLAIDALPEESQRHFLGFYSLDEPLLIETVYGGPMDLISKTETFIVGVKTATTFNSLFTSGGKSLLTTTSVTPESVYKVRKHMKSTEDQMKALDLMRSAMLGALSFLGRSETGEQR